MKKLIFFFILFTSISFSQTWDWFGIWDGVPADTIPIQFAFTDITSANFSTAYTSNGVALTGFDNAYAYAAGDEFRIGALGSWVTAYTIVDDNDTLFVRKTSSAICTTAVNNTLTVGSISDTYTVTTGIDTTPTAFTFTDITNADISTVYTSDGIVLTGIGCDASIYAGGGSYRIGVLGSWAIIYGTASLGDTIYVKLTSSGSYETAVTNTLTIGGVSDTYSVTTGVEPITLVDTTSTYRLIHNIVFDPATIDTGATGSDNFPVTWASNDTQYVSWGDGGGFGGNNSVGRVNTGIGEILDVTAPADTNNNINGGINPSSGNSSFESDWGYNYGLLAIDTVLWMWRNGNNVSVPSWGPTRQELWKSTDKGYTWDSTSVGWDSSDFGDAYPLFGGLSFVQYDKGFTTGRGDNYVYSIIVGLDSISGRVTSDKIYLVRVHQDSMTTESAYHFFTGSVGNESWGTLANRTVIYPNTGTSEDTLTMISDVSMIFHPTFKTYILTVYDNNYDATNAKILIANSNLMWGTYRTCYWDNPFDSRGAGGNEINFSTKAVYANWSQKWMNSSNDSSGVMIYVSHADNFATIEAVFDTNSVDSINSYSWTVLLDDANDQANVTLVGADVSEWINKKNSLKPFVAAANRPDWAINGYGINFTPASSERMSLADTTLFTIDPDVGWELWFVCTADVNTSQRDLFGKYIDTGNRLSIFGNHNATNGRPRGNMRDASTIYMDDTYGNAPLQTADVYVIRFYGDATNTHCRIINLTDKTDSTFDQGINTNVDIIMTATAYLGWVGTGTAYWDGKMWLFGFKNSAFTEPQATLILTEIKRKFEHKQ